MDEPEHQTPEIPRKPFVSPKLLGLVGCVILIAGAVLAKRWVDDKRESQYNLGCKEATAKQNWDDLKRISEAWREWNPNSNESLLFQAEAAVQLGDAETAVALLGMVDDNFHNILEVLALRGEIQFGDLNLPYAAEETWQRMLQINPEATLPRQRLIYFCSMTLQRKRMVELINQGIDLGCEPPEAYAYLLLSNNLNFTDGVLVLGKWREKYPDDQRLEVAEAIFAGRNKYDGHETVQEKSDVAPGNQEQVNECLNKYPNDLEVIAYHIEKKIYENDTDGIVKLLQQAPEAATEDSRFWRFRGWLLRTQNRLPESREALERSLELDQFNWHARYELSNVLRVQGELKEAARQSEISILGKTIERKLFESPDARNIDRSLVEDMIRFMDAVGAKKAATAFRTRTGVPAASSEN